MPAAKQSRPLPFEQVRRGAKRRRNTPVIVASVPAAGLIVSFSGEIANSPADFLRAREPPHAEVIRDLCVARRENSFALRIISGEWLVLCLRLERGGGVFLLFLAAFIFRSKSLNRCPSSTKI